MKKLLVTTTVLMASIAAQSQIKLGVQVSTVLSNPQISNFSANAGSTLDLGFGIVSEFKLGNTFLFRPGLNYLQTGKVASYNNTSGGAIVTSFNERLNVQNIEMPLEITVPIKMGNATLLISAAPTITYAIKANYSINSEVLTGVNAGNVSETNLPITLGSSTGGIKPLDVGSRFGLGVALKNGVQINALYKRGLNNVSNDAGETYKNHHFAVSAAVYLFKGK